MSGLVQWPNSLDHEPGTRPEAHSIDGKAALSLDRSKLFCNIRFLSKVTPDSSMSFRTKKRQPYNAWVEQAYPISWVPDCFHHPLRLVLGARSDSPMEREGLGIVPFQSAFLPEPIEDNIPAHWSILNEESGLLTTDILRLCREGSTDFFDGGKGLGVALEVNNLGTFRVVEGEHKNLKVECWITADQSLLVLEGDFFHHLQWIDPESGPTPSSTKTYHYSAVDAINITIEGNKR